MAGPKLAGKPLSTHPYQVQRKYGPVQFSTTLEAAKKLIENDLADLEEFVYRARGTGDQARASIDQARVQLANWWGEKPLKIEFEMDAQTGVRYSVEVKKRD